MEFARQPIADHANQLAAGIQQNLKRSLEGLGVVRRFFCVLCDCLIGPLSASVVAEGQGVALGRLYGACMHFVCFQDILIGAAKLTGPHTIKYNLPGRVDVGGEVTAKDIMLATGSVPFVPPGIPIDGKTVSCTSCLMASQLCRTRLFWCACKYIAVASFGK